MKVSVLPLATSSRSPLPYWKRTLPGRLSCSVPAAERPRASVCTKLAVIVCTERMCAPSLVMSGDSAAKAGAAAAMMATGTSARAKELAKVIPYSWRFCAGNWRLAIECGLNLSVPYRSGARRSDRVPLGVDQHFAASDMVRLADEAVLFHALDQPCRAVVADAQLALEIGGRGLLAFSDDLYGLAIELSLCVVLAGRLAVEQIAPVLRLFGDRLDVVGRALFPPMLGDRAHLFVRHERAVDAD